MPHSATFPITSVSREDLEDIGFDTTSVDDRIMEDLAERLADDYCEQLFWGSLEILAEHLKIPRREPSPSSRPNSI